MLKQSSIVDDRPAARLVGIMVPTKLAAVLVE
jgi:hypothetical protein